MDIHNSYTSSTLWSFRTKGSVSISFSDYFNLLNPKLDKTPVEASHCYSCCPCSCSCCSTLYTRKIAVSPSILYGLRQSSLIQCSPTRRFVLRCGNGCLSRFLGCDLNYDDYEFSNSFRGRRSSGDGWRSMGKVKCMASEERSSGYWLSGVADVEDVLSLLSDQVDDVCLGTIDRYQRSLRRVSSEKRRDYGTECLRERMRVEVKKQSDCDSERCSGKKKIGKVEEGNGGNVRHLEKKKKDISSCLENKAEHNVKSVAINFRKEDCGRTEERESSTKADSHKRRTKCSSCSSYYSPSSTEDFESDTETLEKEAQFLKESFVENDNDSVSVRYEANRIGGKVGQKSVKHAGGDEEVHEERYNMANSSSYWDLRKKSEKKLAEVSTEEMQSTNKSAEVHSKLGKTYETEHVKESGYSKQYDCEDDMNYMVSSSQRTRKENIHVKNQVSQWSESHKDVSKVSEQSETQKKHQYVSEKSGLWSQNRFSTRDEMVDASTNSGRLYKNTRFLNDDTERSTLQEHSESKVKRHEEKEKNLLMEQKLHQRTEFSEGSEEMINISTDVDAAISSYGSTEKRMLKQESNLKKEAKLVGETINRYQGTSETAMHMKSGKQPSKSVIIRSPSEGADGSSSIQLSLVSQSGEQRIGKVEAEKRSTQAIVMPPLSQLVVAGSENENMTKVISKEAPGTTSESGTFTKYMASGGRTSSEFLESSGESTGRRRVEPFNVPSPEDSLGSAHRLEESSVHFVGEFIERVSHEVSTSKIQTETKSSNLKWVEEADIHGHESSNQLVKENSQRKRSESRQSSDGSGAQGPSDEIWDVTETSAQEPHETEVPESSSTGEQTVIKRSGKSLWNIMVDIVRLRWGSHATSSSSAARSGGKTSPNVSAESEAWFSGRETDENGEENKKREGASVPQESIAQQLEPGKASNQVQGEVSELIKVTANKNELEKNVSSASDESELSLKDNLSVYVEVNQGRNGSLGVMELPKSSVPLQSSRIRRAPTVEQITKVDEIGTTVSGSMEAKEQLQGLSPVEVSPESRTKGGQLQPRKLQRTKQVLRDRFDEWEEAYKLETEQRKVDEMFMKEALLEAKKAADIWEVPVGAVLVQHGKIIARGCNLVEELRDSTAHAEMICIREASNLLRSWRLADTTLYVTLEPCPMCAGAILQARIDTLVWGAPNKLLGADGSWIRIFPDGEGGNGSDQTDKSAAPVHPFHPKINIRRAVLASDCSDVMQQFFQLRRKKKKEVEKSPPPSCLPVPGHPSKLLNKMHGVFHFMFCL